jgi:cystathionine beta-lyase
MNAKRRRPQLNYDFDKVVERQGSFSIKYDFERRGYPRDAIPLWVADMDFQAPPCVLEALEKEARHGIFGYSEPDDAYFDVLRQWFSTRFGWSPEPEWHVKTPGVVVAVYLAVRGLTERGDAVLIQQPVYYPFASAIRDTGRKLVVSELACGVGAGEDNGEIGGGDGCGYYSIDFDDFERKIAENGVKLFILCNPHNPVGRVWTEDELRRMGAICLRHGVTVFSDEIHQDFVYSGFRHTVFAGLSDELADISVTATAPSKTFNLAGLQASNIFVKNKGLREAFLGAYRRAGLSQNGVMGLVSCKAAYEGGADWLEQLLTYLEGNIALIERRAAAMEGVSFRKPEGTYLGWMDFRGLGLKDAELESLLKSKAKVWLSDGRTFGAGGAGFMRVNFACPRSVLNMALERVAAKIC